MDNLENRPSCDATEDAIIHYDSRVADRDFCKEIFDKKFGKQAEKPNEQAIRSVEEALNIRFGEEFSWILHDYGKLYLYYFDMLGIYNDAPVKSALPKQTQRFRKRTQKLNDYFVFAVPNDAFAACCDQYDRVALYSIWDDRVISLNLNVAAYIAGEGLLAEQWFTVDRKNED